MNQRFDSKSEVIYAGCLLTFWGESAVRCGPLPYIVGHKEVEALDFTSVGVLRNTEVTVTALVVGSIL